MVSIPIPVNVTRTDDGATITVDMPGVDPNDLELTFDNGTLAIAGKRGERTYRHNVALGDTIDLDAIEAKLDKGVLTVQARQRPETKPRKILVGGGQGAGTRGIEVILQLYASPCARVEP